MNRWSSLAFVATMAFSALSSAGGKRIVTATVHGAQEKFQIELSSKKTGVTVGSDSRFVQIQRSKGTANMGWNTPSNYLKLSLPAKVLNGSVTKSQGTLGIWSGTGDYREVRVDVSSSK